MFDSFVEKVKGWLMSFKVWAVGVIAFVGIYFNDTILPFLNGLFN